MKLNSAFRPLFRLGVALLLTVPAVASAATWGHWRGPNFNGTTTNKAPIEFSRTNNVKWVVDMPGPAASTPIVAENVVFVSSTDLETKNLYAICLDRHTGRQLWREQVGTGYAIDEMHNFASPSPVTDGKLVVFFFGTGDMAAFDFSGKKLWARNLQTDYGEFAFNYAFASNPTLFEGKLFEQVLQRDVPTKGRGAKNGSAESFLLALDPQTGKEIYRHVRETDAILEAREAYTTPIPYNDAGRMEILVAGGDYLTAHDPQTGAEIWRWGTYNPKKATNFRLVPSPTAAGDIVLICAPQRSPLYAIKTGGKGKLDDSALVWKSEARELSSDVASPVVWEGRFYVLNGERQTIARVDPATGKADWIGELGNRIKIESSPTCAAGMIYFQNFKGEVFIVEAGEQFKPPTVIPMGERNDNQVRSSISIAHGNLFIRNNTKLYCVGK